MTPKELSAGNERVREAAKLAQKKFRRESGCILIEGTRLVADALASGAAVREIFCTPAFLESDHGKAIRVCCGGTVTAITEAAAAKLSDTRTPQGVFAVVEFAPATLDHVMLGIDALVLVADNIADPGNLGTMIRSAAALGAQCVIASGDSCDPGNPKVVRATMGAIFRVPVVGEVELADTVKMLRSHGLQIAAAVARGGRPPWEADLDRPTALLIGSEADGLPADIVRSADAAITIPMHHGAESLNAAACATALLYEAARQRAKGGSGAAPR
jgi:TrmH family RNA methyltransferase